MIRLCAIIFCLVAVSGGCGRQDSRPQVLEAWPVPVEVRISQGNFSRETQGKQIKLTGLAGEVLSAQVAVRSSQAIRGLAGSVGALAGPGGAVIPADRIQALAELGRSRGLFLLFDETYEHFTYGDSRHVSLASCVKAADDFCAIVGSVSKTYSMTGWRIGYVVAHRELIDKIGQFNSHAAGNAASVSQKAALAALKSDPELVRAMREEYFRRRAFVLEQIEGIPGFSCARPDGAFYVFPNVTDCLSRGGFACSEELSTFLLREARVATVPGSAFGLEGYIRLSYATSMENLRDGLSRIRAAVVRRLGE